jgi:hypothetical protein
LIQYISTSKKIFTVGDIHGCFTELLSIYNQLDNDTLFFSVGDLIDRGPDSIKVLDFFISNNLHAVRGNHEDMLLECKDIIFNIAGLLNNTSDFDDPDFIDSFNDLKIDLKFTDWWMNGGERVFNDYLKLNDSFSTFLTHINWIENLPIFIVINFTDNPTPVRDVLISHSFAIPFYDILNDAIDNNSTKVNSIVSDSLWNRIKHLSAKKNKTGLFNIFGHTPIDVYSKEINRKQGVFISKPVIDINYGVANLDTGCCYTSKKHGRGFLTGLFYPSLDIIQVEKK